MRDGTLRGFSSIARLMCIVTHLVSVSLYLPSAAQAQNAVARSPEEGGQRPPPPRPSPSPPPGPLCACGQELKRTASGWVCGCPSGKHTIDEYLANGDMRCIDPLPANWRARGAILLSTRRQDAAGRVALPALPGISVGQRGKVCADVLTRACGTTFDYESSKNTWRTVPEFNHPDFVNIAAGDPRYAFRGHDSGGFSCSRHDAAGGWYLPDTKRPGTGQLYNGCCDWKSPVCPFFTVQVEQGAGDGNKFENIYQRANIPQCLKNLLQSYVNACRGDTQGSSDCTAKLILGSDFKGTGDSRLMFMAWDANCNAKRLSNKSEWDAYPACQAGFFRTASPISLLFGKNTEDVSSGVFTQFPLNPGKSNVWYRWKASEDEPLVVYDPGHKGVITSAHQLFGEWTFGGQRQASLLSVDGTFASPVKWENGFQALATLDRDGDAALRGEELEALGLWFDRNRDGVSQEGEVVPLRKADVTALFVTPNRNVAATKSVIADIGYERLVNGKVRQGAAVDWFGEEIDSPFQAVVASSFEVNGSSEREVTVLSPVSKNPDAKERRDSNISGIWQWKSSESTSAGLLYLAEGANGSVRGYSFVPAQAAGEVRSEDTTAGAAAVVPLEGKVVVSDSNEIYLELHTKDNNVGLTITRATLSQDGSALHGTSDYRSEGMIGTPFSYSWTAARLLEGDNG